MKLVGSRGAGTNRPDSDWDVSVPGIINVQENVSYGKGNEFPLWLQALKDANISISELKSQARKLFNIPEHGDIDLFFSARCECAGKELFAIIHEEGCVVGMGNSLRAAARDARRYD